MAKAVRERRRARRAADLEAEVRAQEQARKNGCIECGRGELDTSLLAPPYDTINTKLVIVRCSDDLAHRPPAGRHIGRCGGWVYRHENERICAAVKAAGREAVAAVASGAN